MEDYSAKLTGEPFLYEESKIIARYLLEGEDPTELRKRNVEENLIKHKKVSSIERTNSPIFRRLSVFNKDMLYEFVNGDIETSKYLLLYSCMKTDRLISDFVTEVYKDKLILKKDYIERIEIENWFEEKCILSETLKNKSQSTIYKLKQVLMLILVESGIVEKEKERFKIIRPLLRDRFITLLDVVGDIDYANAIGGLR
jgi:hypothetical protein